MNFAPITRAWFARGKEIRALRADLNRLADERDMYRDKWMVERQDRLDAELLEGWMGGEHA